MKKQLRRIIRLTYKPIAIILLSLFLSSFFYALYLKWLPPFTTSLMVQRAYENSGKSIRCSWVPIDKISMNARIAVIAEEDQLFAFHHGFDFESMEKAFEHNSSHKRIRGGSTISQQVAKNIFLWNGRSYIRKGLEAYFTLLIETLWTKERILEMYLNVAEMGDGIFGIHEASLKYFHVPASRMSAPQAALIAAVLPNPRLYRADKPSAYVIYRQQKTLRFMRMIGGRKYLNYL